MQSEKRREPRRHLIFYLKVVHPESNELIGHLVDISTIGMMIICENELAAGQKLPVRLILPAVFESARHLDVMGETIWCHKDVNPNYYAVGFRFSPSSTETALVIRELVQSFGFQD